MKTIRDFDLKNKTVIIRCDFNVPMKDGIITDDNRIRESLKTINYAIKKGAKIILLSHLGRVKTEEDKIKNNLKPVCQRLSELLERNVIFSEETRGRKVRSLVNDLKPGEVLLLQNTRYEDIPGKKESGNDSYLGRYWASLGDIFVNDAFGTAHRKHASNVGIARHLPSGIGFLMEKELKYLNKIVKKPVRPYVVIMGGAKISDKITITKNLLEKADYLLIGGAMAFTFLRAAGFNIGASKYEKEAIDFCTDLLNKYSEKIVLPIDIVVSDEISDNVKPKTRFINEIEDDEIGLDIGPSTLKVFKQYLDDSKTIFWNGPVGYFEIESFAGGTKKLCDIITNTKAMTIVGGGDTASAVINLGYRDKFTHISTGGGASLEFLEGKTLPALKVIDEKSS